MDKGWSWQSSILGPFSLMDLDKQLVVRNLTLIEMNYETANQVSMSLITTTCKL
jgi:hypothetical protein